MESELQPGHTLRQLPKNDLPRAAQLEASSYPPDEAASPAQLEFRCTRAAPFFRGLYDGGELVGFVVGTCSTAAGGRLEHASMSAHDESGAGPLTLMIHSVVIAEARRRSGLGRAMVRAYLRALATSRASPESRVSRVLLISKAANLPLYLACGFGLVGRSPVVHGREAWYELALALPELRASLADAARGARAERMVQVDAFSGAPFAGNPAAVVFSQRGGDAAWMLAVAAENNLAETAFVEPAPSGATADGAAEYGIRWFTPAVEVDLCGHATIAAAHALWESGRACAGAPIRFQTLRAGSLLASRLPDGFVRIELGAANLEPADQALRPDAAADLALLLTALGLGPRPAPRAPGEAVVGPPHARDLLVQLSRAEWDALAAVPDLRVIRAVTARLGLRGLVPTVAGDGCAGGSGAVRSRLYASLCAAGGRLPRIDFTSRFFAPAVGIDEDPVTGSAHALLATFWDGRAGPPAGQAMLGYQASARGGLVRVRAGERACQIEGEATTVLRGQLLT